jgi:hypothetical protein
MRRWKMFYHNVIEKGSGSIRKISWSWADILILGLADGSHDDGAGGQSMEVLNIFKN